MIHRAFFEQMARRAVEFPPPAVPVIIFMGTEDESIPFERVRGVWDRWRAGQLHDRSRFVAVDGGDHRLTDQIGPVAEQIKSLIATSAQV
jgi:alpha-beta hydrolase superfamily lysophospholipase